MSIIIDICMPSHSASRTMGMLGLIELVDRSHDDRVVIRARES